MAQKVKVKTQEAGPLKESNGKEVTNMSEKKPIYKKWWFWVLIVLIIGIIALATSGGDSSAGNESVTPAGSGTTATQKAADKTNFNVGETYSDRNIKITFTGANDNFTNIQEYSDVPAGKKVIQATFDFENVGSSDFLASDWDFKCYADNESCEEFIWVDNYSFSDNLSAGKTASGRSVYFTVPEGAASIVLEYEPDFWSSKKIEFVVK